ncbi:MAG: metallophosphoesterase [Candidatus Bipolaricaulota bacterium]
MLADRDKASPPGSRRSHRRRALATLGVVALALAAYAFLVEPTWVEVRETLVAVRGLPASFEGFTVLHLSDLHLDSRPGAQNLEQAIAVAASIQPDLIAITGDFVSGFRGAGFEIIARLDALDAPHGVVAVLGNHDMAAGSGRIEAELGVAGVRVLRNERLTISRGDEQISIVGLDDPGFGEGNWEAFGRAAAKEIAALDALLAEVPDGEARLLLVHNPDMLELARGRDLGLALCGHTHGGQVYVPWIGAVWVPSYFGLRFARSPVDVDGLPVVISRGLGTITLPVRFLARPEVGVVRLTAL